MRPKSYTQTRTRPLRRSSRALGVGGAEVGPSVEVARSRLCSRLLEALALLRGEDLDRVDLLLQHLSRRVDVDGGPATCLLAEPAADALLRVDRRHPVEVVVVRGVLQGKRLERADVDAELTAGADAV